MSSIVNAWYNAEQICGNWIISTVGAEYGVNGFIGEMPKDFQYSEEDGMCFFELSGGGTPLDDSFNMDHAGGFGDKQIWRMTGKFSGIYTERKRAMQIAGLLRQHLPVSEDSLAGIFRFRRGGEPTIERYVIPRRSDQAKGGDIRVWRIEMMLDVWFRPSAV